MLRAVFGRLLTPMSMHIVADEDRSSAHAALNTAYDAASAEITALQQASINAQRDSEHVTEEMTAEAKVTAITSGLCMFLS